MNRDAIRKALIGTKHKGNSEIVKLFGVEIELRQPTLGAIIDARSDDDEKTRTTDIFINYSYVPGTDEKVFETTDRASILIWPFNDDILQVQIAITKLTGIDVSDAVEEINADPLEDSS